MLAGVVSQERMNSFLAALDDPQKFNRPHRIPTLAADDPGYDKNGGYWRVAVWAPTTYMVLRELRAIGHRDLAYSIALNHFNSVTKVFRDTGTFFENYCLEKIEGRSRKNHVGWSGLPPIVVLLEYIFGLQPDIRNNTLIWDIRLTDEFGVEKYPFGNKVRINLSCAKRNKTTDEPQITISSPRDLKVILLWKNGRKELNIKAST